MPMPRPGGSSQAQGRSVAFSPSTPKSPPRRLTAKELLTAKKISPDKLVQKMSTSPERTTRTAALGPSSLILPSPALGNVPAKAPPDFSDTSPLLAGSAGAPHSANRNYSAVPEEEPPKVPPVPATTSMLPDDSKRRDSVTSAAVDPPGSGPARLRFTPVPAEMGQGYPLDFINKAGKLAFIQWVNSEVDKIDAFYQLKEKEAVERFLLLQDQLMILYNQRRYQKLKMHESDGVSHVTQHARLAILKRVDLPSLPNIAVRRARTEPADVDIEAGPAKGVAGGNGSTDYERKANPIPYTHAKRQLKAAVTEYYRSLELLNGYRALNRTAIRKIVKKFDKTTGENIQGKYLEQIKGRQFVKSETLDILISRTERLYAFYFEGNNHKHAVEKLRAPDSRREHYSSTFSTGLFLGLGVPLFVDAIVAGVRNLSNPDKPDTQYLFQIWGGFFLVNLMLCLFMLNLFVWTSFKINYPFIFEFSPRHRLDYQQFGELPMFMFFLLSLFGWFTFRDFWPDSYPAKFFPPIYLGLAVLILFLPLPILYWRARKWLVIALWRLLCSGLYPVEFRDFFLGDIFCSLNYSLSNASMFFCLYATQWAYSYPFNPVSGSKCSSSHSRVLGFLNTLPGIWRFLQCWRRYGDTRQWFPHLANAGKYSCLILYYVFLSLARINRANQTWKILTFFFAALNAVYSSIWDIFMDFSLGQFGAKHPGLRTELSYHKSWPYYAVMVIDPIMRMNWVLYAAYWNQVEQSAKISFIVALIEVVRRFLWVFFRVENEHATNVVRFRASRDLELPYEGAAATTLVERGIFESEPVQPSEPGAEGAPPSVRRRPSIAREPSAKSRVSKATPVLAAVSMALRRAHAADFERRRPDPERAEEEGSDDDEDDDMLDEAATGTGISREQTPASDDIVEGTEQLEDAAAIAQAETAEAQRRFDAV